MKDYRSNFTPPVFPHINHESKWTCSHGVTHFVSIWDFLNIFTERLLKEGKWLYHCTLLPVLMMFHLTVILLTQPTVTMWAYDQICVFLGRLPVWLLGLWCSLFQQIKFCNGGAAMQIKIRGAKRLISYCENTPLQIVHSNLIINNFYLNYQK